jgi:hypothetical protein
MADPINPGDVVRVRTNDPAVAGSGFVNGAGALTDPTTVVLKWNRHGESVTVWTWTSGTPGPNIVRDSVGVFHADITVVEPGLHYFRWEGTGAVVAVAEGTFSAESFFVVGSP